MTRKSWLLLSVALLACQKPGDAKSGADSKDLAQGAGAAGAGAPGPSAAGDEPTPVGAVSECPKSLAGDEKQHRVIGKQCGVVPVTGDLNIDGGSLTLEAGATLAFKEGAGLYVGYSEGGRLIVKGTAQEPVVFTSAGDKAPGAWKGVTLYERAARSRIEGLVIEFAGAEESALRIEAADVTLTGSTLREIKGAAVSVGDNARFAAFSNNTFTKIGKPGVMEVPPAALGGLGAGNRFDAGAHVLVRAGEVRESAKWQPIGAPLVVAGEVSVDGDKGQRTTVELLAGSELRFTEAGWLSVGYSQNATLKASGSAEAPVLFTAHERRERGGWRGLRIYGSGEADVQHAVFEFGGQDEQGVITVDGGGSLALRASTVRENHVGLRADERAKIAALSDNKFSDTPIAVDVPANHVGAIAAGNSFAGGARIRATAGTVQGKTTWRNLGAPIELGGEVVVDDGELTLEAGLSLLATTDGKISIGYAKRGSLIVQGSGAAPVTIAPVDGAGAWGGITFYTHAKDAALENLVLVGVEQDPAIRIDNEASAKLTGVKCSRCAGAVVGWDCRAQVSTSAIEAADGTPRTETRPEGC
ncbi:MAG TPA: hypothetical protein VIK91_03520 [Nannocystis sp.]